VEDTHCTKSLGDLSVYWPLHIVHTYGVQIAGDTIFTLANPAQINNSITLY
jgi:hypothetical protein